MNIKEYIRTVPNYPVAGINFYDLNSLFASNIWPIVIENMAVQTQSTFNWPSHIVGIESRGFVVGAALAQVMRLPFVMVRKKGAKYPGKLLEQSYELEYGSDTLTLQEGIVGHTSRVIIADDLVATGGSMLATTKLIEQTGATILGGVTIVNIKYLNSPKLESIIIESAYETNMQHMRQQNND